MACQICLKDYSDLFAEYPWITRVQQLCGADSGCTGDVCSHCLELHVQITVDSCIRGILPRVRCPICLRTISKAQWGKFLPGMLLHDYEQLAAQAFAVTTPCCHEPTYTHLPERDISVTSETRVDIHLLTGWEDPPKAFETLMDEFLRHRADASCVVAFLVSAEGIHNLEVTLHAILQQIYDDERRGALYLSYLNRFPATATMCCRRSFCFNCKGTQCGLVCETNEDGFDEAGCMVRCRQCRVMIVATDGCDSVDCLCGFEMSWENELRYRDMAAKDLISIDILDLQLVKAWEAKRTMLMRELAAQYEAIRLRQLTRLISVHRLTLQRCLCSWRQHLYLRRMKEATALMTCGRDLYDTSVEAALKLVEGSQ